MHRRRPYELSMALWNPDDYPLRPATMTARRLNEPAYCYTIPILFSLLFKLSPFYFYPIFIYLLFLLLLEDEFRRGSCQAHQVSGSAAYTSRQASGWSPGNQRQQRDKNAGVSSCRPMNVLSHRAAAAAGEQR